MAGSKFPIPHETDADCSIAISLHTRCTPVGLNGSLLLAYLFIEIHTMGQVNISGSLDFRQGWDARALSMYRQSSA